jgi:hypothetical protein
MYGLDSPHDLQSSSKKSALGISAAGRPQDLIKTLGRLGLVPGDLGESLQKLAAAGGKPGEFYQVSVYDLDQALAQTEASLEQRMAFKASLHRNGLLVVPKV